MDVVLIVILFFVFFFLFSVCGWCCRKNRQGVVFGYGGTPVTVATTTIAPNVNSSPAVAAYPIGQGAPAPGFIHPGHQQSYPPPAPGFYYPPAGGNAYAGVYPPQAAPVGFVPGPMSNVPYPPHSAPPPTYNEAVTQPPLPANVTSEVYSKQAPYNPNY